MLQQIAQDHSEENLTVLAVNTGESEDAIRDFLDEISVDLPVLVDQNAKLMNRFEVLFLPMTYFIDGDWILRYRTVGEPNEKQLDHGLSAILADRG